MLIALLHQTLGICCCPFCQNELQQLYSITILQIVRVEVLKDCLFDFLAFLATFHLPFPPTLFNVDCQIPDLLCRLGGQGKVCLVIVIQLCYILKEILTVILQDTIFSKKFLIIVPVPDLLVPVLCLQFLITN